jgi:hypothetical protein
MIIQELIDKLNEFPADMEVYCITDYDESYRGGSCDDPDLTDIDMVWEPVSEVNMCNDNGNVIRIS